MVFYTIGQWQGGKCVCGRSGREVVVAEEGSELYRHKKVEKKLEDACPF